MNVKGILEKTICTVTGTVAAVQCSIQAKASSLEEIIGSSGASGSTDNNVFLNPDGSNAEEVLNSILNSDNNAAAQGQALGEVTDTIKALGNAGVSLAQLIFMYVVLGAFIVSFICLLIKAGNAAEAANERRAFALRVITAICGFGVVGMVLVIMKVGYRLF